MREFIFQEDEKGCGLACLRMALIEATGQSGYKYLQIDGHPPYNLKNLQRAASEEGVEINFYRAQSSSELKNIRAFPTFLLLNEDGREHLVYVPKAKGDKLLLFDPAKGKFWVKVEQVSENWNLIYADIKVTRKEKCRFKKPKIIPFWQCFVLTLLEILSCGLLFAGFYLMNDDSNYLLSIAMLASYGVFEILSRSFLMEAMKKFDKKWLRKIIEIPKESKNRFKHYYELKKVLFPGFASFIGTIVTVVALTILFGMNNPIFFIAEAFLAAYSLFYAIFAHQKIHKRVAKLKVNERMFIDSKDNSNKTLENLQRINGESYRIGTFISYEKIIYAIVVVMLALLFFINVGSISLNYYLLYFGALYLTGEKLKEILEYLMNNASRERETLYFYEYFIKEDS